MTKTNVPWTDAELKILKENYCKPDGIKIIQTLLPHRGYNSIKGMANVRFGLRRKPVFEKRHNFFSVPNDHNNVIAGFIAADGCIGDSHRLTITLSSKDADHLESIRQQVGYTGRIYEYKMKERLMTPPDSVKTYIIGKTPIVTLQIGDCNQWLHDLNQIWNITPRKTHTLRPPNLTNLRHIICYLSGLIDGDGWICLNNKADSKHGKVLEISVMGTKELMTWVKRVFDFLTPGQIGGQIKPTSSPNGAVYTVRGTRAYLIAKIFLSLDILRLERKWAAAREYIALLESTGGVTPKMQRWISLSGFDSSLPNRLQTEEILLPLV